MTAWGGGAQWWLNPHPEGRFPWTQVYPASTRLTMIQGWFINSVMVILCVGSVFSRFRISIFTGGWGGGQRQFRGHSPSSASSQSLQGEPRFGGGGVAWRQTALGAAEGMTPAPLDRLRVAPQPWPCARPFTQTGRTQRAQAQVQTRCHTTPTSGTPTCTHAHVPAWGLYLPLTLRTILGWEIHTGPFGCESSCPERWQDHGWSRRGDTHTA